MKISDVLIHLTETMKAYGDLEVGVNVYLSEEEQICNSLREITTEQFPSPSKDNKMYVQLSD